MSAVYDFYKPLRNHLRQVSLRESLEVIRAYTQNLCFGHAMPANIELDPAFAKATHWPDKKIFPWELELLVKEILLHSSDIAATRTLRRWSTFAGAVNKLKALENEIYGIYRKQLSSMILLELYRLAHRQFPWQRPHNMIRLNRYYKIFGAPELEPLVRRVLGMTTWELYIIGLALTGVHLKYFALNYPPNIEIREITRATLDRFLAHFARPLADLRQDIQHAQRLDQDFAYAYNPMRAYPLIRMDIDGRDSVACPMPPLLLHRFTDGLYYELCAQRDFAGVFGASFQRYVGEVLDAAFAGSQASVHPEAEYTVGKERKDTVDWIVDDPSAILFVECKTKRLRQDAKTAIISTEVLEEELDVLTGFILQVYKTLADCRAGHYTHFALDSQRPVFPVVATLEEWYAFGPRILDAIDARVRRLLPQAGLDQNLLTLSPWSVCSIDELERMAQIMKRTGIKSFMASKLRDPEKRQWPFHSYMAGQFPDELKRVEDLFPEALLDRQPQDSEAVVRLRQALDE